MRGVMMAATLLLAVLAGCADSNGTETTDSGTDGNGAADRDGADGGAGGEVPDEVNGTGATAVPVARLALDVVNGTAPLSVNFTIDASNATAWRLDFGDGNATDGTLFPAAANHTFGAGAYNVTLRVQGEGGNDTATAGINVAAAPEDDVPGLEPFTETVGLDLPCPACGDVGTLSCTWRAHGNGNAQDCAWIDFPDELAGQPFTLTGNGLDQDVLFWDACNDGVNDKFNGLLDGESGVVPDGAGCALVWEQFDLLIDVTLTITPE